MQSRCKRCNSYFQIQEIEKNVLNKLYFDSSDLLKFISLCPNCRQQQRFIRRNERNLYKRKCDKCWKSIISIYSTDKPFPVYCSDCWRGDWRDATQWQMEFDFSKTLFEHFYQLFQKVPRLSLILVNSENSVYNNYSDGLKNCYFCFDCSELENCLYCYNVGNSKNCVDCIVSNSLENCYSCIFCFNSYKLFWSKNCEGCKNGYFLQNCKNCEECIGCVNLANKKYCIFNQAYEKEEYFKLKEKLLSNISKLEEQFKQFSRTQPKPNLHIVWEENKGDYLIYCKNCDFSFDSGFCEDCSYITNSVELSDCSDVDDCSGKTYLCWQVIGGTNNHKAVNSMNIESCNDVWRCDHCFGVQDSMLSIGLKNNKYFILNKPYTKSNYIQLKIKILEHAKETGEILSFFPLELSPFAYNETVNIFYYPLTSQQAIEQGFKWKEEERDYANIEIINNIPDINHLTKNDEVILLTKAIRCKVSWRPFRLTKAELQFYKKFKIPIPTVHPDERFRLLLKQKNPRKLQVVRCKNCGKEVYTSYLANEMVYCKDCFEKYIVW